MPSRLAASLVGKRAQIGRARRCPSSGREQDIAVAVGRCYRRSQLQLISGRACSQDTRFHFQLVDLSFLIAPDFTRGKSLTGLAGIVRLNSAARTASGSKRWIRWLSFITGISPLLTQV